MNVHLHFGDTAYGDFEGVRARLRELGVRFVRDGLCATCADQIPRLNHLAADGVRANIIAGDLRGGSALMAENLRAIRDRLRGTVVSVEAPNEPDMTGDPAWITKTRAYQRDLYSSVRADPGLTHLNVLAPALATDGSEAALGDLSSYIDRGNFHPYSGGGMPLHNLASESLLTAQVSRTKRLVATEAGYHSDLTTRSGHPPTSERAIGIYTPRLALNGFMGGVERTYIYQLADLWSTEEARQRGFSDLENSFGLLRHDLTPKPAYTALKNLLDAVDADTPPVADPGGLRYRLEGAPDDLHQLLLRSGPNAYSLVLWREVSVWDRDARRDLYPAADTTTIEFGQPIAAAQRHNPTTSPTAQQTWQDPRRIDVDLAGGPVVIRLTP